MAEATLAIDDEIDAHLRLRDPDRWLSSRLIADPAARREVLALYAFEDAIAASHTGASRPSARRRRSKSRAPLSRPSGRRRGFGQPLVRFATLFVELIEARHTADYDPVYRVRTEEARRFIRSSRRAIRNFEASDPAERKLFLAFLICDPKSN